MLLLISIATNQAMRHRMLLTIVIDSPAVSGSKPKSITIRFTADEAALLEELIQEYDRVFSEAGPHTPYGVAKMSLRHGMRSLLQRTKKLPVSSGL